MAVNAISDFADECLKHTDSVLEAQVNDLIDADYSLEWIIEQVLGPIVVELGDRWQRDVISFIDVQLGVLQIESIVQTLQLKVPNNSDGSKITAAFSATPGDHHTFGVFLAASSLTGRGWDITNLSGLSMGKWFDAIREGSYDAVVLSLCTDSQFPILCEAIKRLKNDSATASVFVVVAGDFFTRNPGCIIESGADAHASTSEEIYTLVHSRLIKRGVSGSSIVSAGSI